MSLPEQIQQDIVAAMKARDQHRLSTLRMVKTALKNREIEKMAPLDDKEAQHVLTTLIKQRKDSVEQFTKGGRQEMADKEAAEIVLIESYMPKAASEDQVIAGVKAAIAEMGTPAMKEMGTVMKNVMARFAGAGIDGVLIPVRTAVAEFQVFLGNAESVHISRLGCLPDCYVVATALGHVGIERVAHEREILARRFWPAQITFAESA